LEVVWNPFHDFFSQTDHVLLLEETHELMVDVVLIKDYLDIFSEVVLFTESGLDVSEWELELRGVHVMVKFIQERS
jgi:hypothetical protein